MVTTFDEDKQKATSPKQSATVADTKATDAINPSTFYGKSATDQKKYSTSYAPPSIPPALPRRQQQGLLAAPTGSQTSDINSYTFGGSSYREPEIIPDEEMQDISSAAKYQTSANAVQSWGSASPSWGGPAWDTNYGANSWGAPGDEQLIGGGFGTEPPIDGRDMTRERRWWDTDYPGAKSSPGPGMLPPMVTDILHNPEHSLVSVMVKPPDITPDVKGSSSSGSISASTSAQQQQSPSKGGGHSRTPSTVDFLPPTPEEIREAVPHPNAYYCRRHNGWVILAWRTSSNLPPVIEQNLRLPLPPSREWSAHNCSAEIQFAPQNKTHHFHRYQRVVDASTMTPSYAPREWERPESSKKSRRRITFGSNELDSDMVSRAVAGDVDSQLQTQKLTEAKEGEEARTLLDLYKCCQCHVHALVSDVIPGVIPVKVVESFTAERRSNPPPGKTDVQSLHTAWETILLALENKLWKGKNQPLSVTSKAFPNKVGWSPNVQKLFESLGFTYHPDASSPQLQPPSTDKSTEVGRSNLARLLRAWLEISVITADLRRSHPAVLKDYHAYPLWVKTENAREAYQIALGAHIDQVPRGLWPDELRGDKRVLQEWEKLGMTESTYEEDFLQFAYLAQCRCDPENTPTYFDAVSNISAALSSVGQNRPNLDALLATERSRGRFTSEDVQSAIRILGFGSENELRLDYDDDVDEEFILNAWRSAVRRSWKEIEGASRRRDLNEAFRIVAESRRSLSLIKEYEEDQLHGMTPDQAYSTLEIPMGVEEDMLLTVYSMRVEEKPSQIEKMRDALRVIAEFTCSERLKQFVEMGADPGPLSNTPMNWPRGLNQLGNTCYLNSLLQYFYTIKDLRDAIAPLAVGDKVAEAGKLKDDDLKHHRVGGRFVSRQEVMRSRKFVSQLAELFSQLETTQAPAVTPTIELAKLALLTSKDEEEDDPERVGTDSSHSTDATLVEESGPVRTGSPVQQKSPKSVASSVLGKRVRGFGFKRNIASKEPDSADEGVDAEKNKDKDDYVLVERASGSDTPMTVAVEDEDVIQMEHVENINVEAEAQTATASKAPPLPPRPKSEPVNSEMMFGRQHDVAECMDNCMFQIETALLRFGQLAGDGEEEKRSLVKRLFYGKMRQRLSVAPEAKKSKSSVHDREDYFAHLPVNVSSESFDLHDGLAGYFEDDVDFEGSKAKMHVSLVELPPILQIQLQRAQFDRETLQPYKSHAYVKFGETICMDRFLDDAPQEKKTRAKEIQTELNKCRDRIQQLTQGKHAPYEENLTASSLFLTEYSQFLPEVTTSLTSSLSNEKERITTELSTLRALTTSLKSQLEDIWLDERRAEYELTSVFIHRGASPTFGHYFIYQRWLPDRPDEWFKYNDNEVTLVGKNEVLADTTGSTANPYLLVFARKDSNVIETVKRTDVMSVD